MEIKTTGDIVYQQQHLMGSLNGTQERRDTLNRFAEKKFVAVDDILNYIKKRKDCLNSIPAHWELDLLEEECQK